MNTAKMPLQSKILTNSFSVMTGSGWQPVSEGINLKESGGWAADIHQVQEHHELVLDIYASA